MKAALIYLATALTSLTAIIALDVLGGIDTIGCNESIQSSGNLHKDEYIIKSSDLHLIIELIETNNKCVRGLINQVGNDIIFPCSTRYMLSEEVESLKSKLTGDNL